MDRDSSTQVELGNAYDLRYLELSRLGTEAILSYLDLSGERRAGEGGEKMARNAPRHLGGYIWEAPSAWLQDTAMLKAAKKKAVNNLSGENPSNSIRVTAARINRNRRAVFARWLPSWQAELEYIEGLLR